MLLLDGLFSCLLASAMVVSGTPLYPRAAQSVAVCTPQFAWMDNSKEMSPCQVSASVDALCNNGNWVLPSLNGSMKYNPPNTQDGTANLCTCSWTSYNLISACTACQGFPEQIPQWSFHLVGCGGFTSDVAFPSNITLPESVSIPFWAAEDPSNWPEETFNVKTAQEIASEGHADLNADPNVSQNQNISIPETSRNFGEILAGVFAGLLIIAMAVVSYMLYQRRKPQPFSELPPAFPNLNVMRLSTTRPIASPYRTFFAPPAYSEFTTNLRASLHPTRQNHPTETQPSTDTSHSRITNSPGTTHDHEMANTWGFENPALLIAMPQAAAQGWNDRKPSAASNHKKQQLRLVS